MMNKKHNRTGANCKMFFYYNGIDLFYIFVMALSRCFVEMENWIKLFLKSLLRKTFQTSTS